MSLHPWPHRAFTAIRGGTHRMPWTVECLAATRDTWLKTPDEMHNKTAAATRQTEPAYWW